jgi:ATP phosphoribosyltransferase
MKPVDDGGRLRFALPKGRMQEGVLGLLAGAGIRVTVPARGYRPAISLPEAEAKILKPQSIVEMLAAGSRDLGFAGADWIAELGADVIDLVDTGLDPVRLVAAAPSALLGPGGSLPARRLIVASEYERLTRRWIAARGIDAVFVRSHGATEVFPPEDADLIVDNTATGSTLRANDLAEIDELMTSSTRFCASRAAMDDPARRERIEGIAMLLASVLEARLRVMVEVNVPADRLEAVVAALPCMREPTLSQLHGGAGYAVKAAVPRELLPAVIPEIRRLGGTDVVVMNLAQIVP